MPMLSGFTLVRSICAIHLTIGYVLLTKPELIADQSSVHILGMALGLSQPTSAFHTSPLASSLLGLMFIFVAICDFIAAADTGEASRAYWGTQVPVRLTFFFTIVGYAYLFKPPRDIAISTPDPIKNSLVFTWGFYEIALWLWTYLSLKDEQAEAMNRLMHQRRIKQQQEMMREE